MSGRNRDIVYQKPKLSDGPKDVENYFQRLRSLCPGFGNTPMLLLQFRGMGSLFRLCITADIEACNNGND